MILQVKNSVLDIIGSYFVVKRARELIKAGSVIKALLRPDQHHTPDTIVLHPDKITKFEETHFKQHQKATLF